MELGAPQLARFAQMPERDGKRTREEQLRLELRNLTKVRLALLLLRVRRRETRARSMQRLGS